MIEFIKMELMTIGQGLRHLFGFLFPEYPSIGILVALLALAMFVSYLFRSGFRAALKIGLVVFIGLSLGLFILHEINRIVHVL